RRPSRRRRHQPAAARAGGSRRVPPPFAAHDEMKRAAGVATARAAHYKDGKSECSAARLAHLSGGQGVVGSNPATPTISQKSWNCWEPCVTFHLSRIGQIAMSVADVDRAEAFYRDTLALPHLYRYGDLSFFDCAGVRLMLQKSESKET